MIQKADIVTMRGLKSDKIGLVEKLFEHEGYYPMDKASSKRKDLLPCLQAKNA